jgi:hypothetical protein
MIGAAWGIKKNDKPNIKTFFFFNQKKVFQRKVNAKLHFNPFLKMPETLTK